MALEQPDLLPYFERGSSLMFLVIGLRLSFLSHLQGGFQLCLDLFYLVSPFLRSRHILLLRQLDVLRSQCTQQLGVETVVGVVG